MEEQEILKMEIGTTEPEKKLLKPAKVKIVSAKVERIEKAKADKAVFEVKHPDSETTIKISSVSYLDGREVVTTGTWINIDKEKKLQKSSALTIFLNRIGAKTVQDAVGRDADTELNEKYLCFKAY